MQMIGTYKREDIITFYANFQHYWEEGNIINNPVITIKHIDTNDFVIEDVIEDSMVLISGNDYYYKWEVPINAHLGCYAAIYNATVDGDIGEGSDSFIITE